jgi:hypothetical protein
VVNRRIGRLMPIMSRRSCGVTRIPVARSDGDARETGVKCSSVPQTASGNFATSWKEWDRPFH